MPDEGKKKSGSNWSLAMRIGTDFGITIAAPVVLLSLAGKWLDSRYQTRPLFIIVGFALAALLSGVSIYRKSKEYAKLYKQL